MTQLFNITFESHKSGNNFDDYSLKLTGIFVNNANMSILAEALNLPNTKYHAGGFNLSGNGFGGFDVLLRMPKQTSPFLQEEIVQHIEDAVNKCYSKLKQA